MILKEIEFDMNEAGKKLAELRGAKSQREVASALGVAPSTYAMYETGERVPRDPIKIRIAKYYRTSVEKIFFTKKTTKSGE